MSQSLPPFCTVPCRRKRIGISGSRIGKRELLCRCSCVSSYERRPRSLESIFPKESILTPYSRAHAAAEARTGEERAASKKDGDFGRPKDPRSVGREGGSGSRSPQARTSGTQPETKDGGGGEITEVADGRGGRTGRLLKLLMVLGESGLGPAWPTG